MTISTIPAPMGLGPYELVRRLATGGMAEVYLARRAGPHGFQKLVALKRILPQFGRDPDFVAMFVDEARVCARLAHPNIVQVFDFGEQDGALYMAMEYVDGTTAARLVRAAAGQAEEIPLDVCLHIALSLLRALEYAHTARDEGGKLLELVHRDVSPGNVLIDRSGTVKLTDFGIARAVEIERRTDAGQLKGKLGYMSPEQVVGRELDARSDLFTLGIVLAEMLILRPLFSGGKELDVLLRIRDADLGAIDRAGARVPDDVRAVLFRALARDPAMRWPSAAAFAEALEEIVRRRRLQVGPARLAAFIERLGLVSAAEGEDGESGTPSTAPIECDTNTRRVLREEEAVAPAPSSKPVAPEIYRVKKGSELLGPMAYPRLVELFATGQLGASSEISRENGRFRPANEVAEVSRFFTSPALAWDTDFVTEAVERGPIGARSVPSRLFRLAVRRETGALALRDGARRKRIFFVEGTPEFVTSTDRSELLGELLVERGQVLRIEVEMALAMLPRTGGHLGDALVGLGVLRPIELFRAIHDQTRERLADAFRWRSGDVVFARGVRSQQETLPLGVDTYELIGRGIRQGYPDAEIEGLLAPAMDHAVERVSAPPVRLEMFRLPAPEAAVLEAVTGKATVRELEAQLVVRGVADRAQVLRAIFLGLVCELLRSPAWPALAAT